MLSSPNSESHKELSTRRAYVLDDEIQIAALVGQVLLANGFDARQFSTPIPFLAETKIAPPELIVLDLALGSSDAVDVIRQLEALQYKGKVLLISGRDEAVLDKIKEIGKTRGLAMLPPLQKPFRLNDLKSRLGAMAEESCVATVAREFLAKPEAVDLGEALRNRWLELWYQPKIDLKSMTVCGAEALVRARHPEHGIVSPAALLPPPGDPLYQPLTDFVIQQALVDWNYLADRQVLLKLAINVPLSVLRASDFVKSVRASLPKDPRFPGLIFEITEDEVTQGVEWIQEIATQLTLCNVWLSIDDFGSGYSSLSRLRDVPCAEIKLDRSFVSNCSRDGAKQSLCAAAIDLAHGLGATICAEGVENVQDLRTLVEMRCDTAQGFLFAKPMGRELFAKMLLNRTVGPKQDFSPSDEPAGGEVRKALTA